MILEQIKLILYINILWVLIPGKTASQCDDFFLHTHLKIKIICYDSRFIPSFCRDSEKGCFFT